MFNTFPRKGKTDFYFAKKKKQFEEIFDNNGVNSIVPVTCLKAESRLDPKLGIPYEAKDLAITFSANVLNGGSIMIGIPDGTTLNGDKRGYNSIDLQYSRYTSGEVVAGNFSYMGPTDGCTIDATSSNTFVGCGFNNSSSGSLYASILNGNGNSINASTYSFIGGGLSNSTSANARFGTIVNGESNSIIGSTHSAILNGFTNLINTTADYQTILGGSSNSITSTAPLSLIGAGTSNLISNNSGRSAVLCGQLNKIQGSVNNYNSAILSGESNTVGSTGNAYNSIISGGSTNSIHSITSFIGAGTANTINLNANYSSIVGGQGNYINTTCVYAVVGGGLSNGISLSSASGIFSGNLNSINAPATYTNDFSFIGGGYSNDITTAAGYNVIGGGNDNSIVNSVEQSVICGGGFNTLNNVSVHSFIGGGTGNTISNYAGCIPGGTGNVITGKYSTGFGHSSSDTGTHGKLSLGCAQSSTVGSSQTGFVVMLARGVGVTAVKLLTDSGSNANQLVLTDGQAVAFKGLITAKKSNTISYAWEFNGLIQRATGAGSTVLLVSSLTAIGGNLAILPTITIAADTTYGTLSISASNSSGSLDISCAIWTNELI